MMGSMDQLYQQRRRAAQAPEPELTASLTPPAPSTRPRGKGGKPKAPRLSATSDPVPTQADDTEE